MAALAEPLIGDADDHDVLHLRQITDDVLDLDDRDVLAAADHDILRASDDRDVAILRHPSKIARLEPAVLEGGGIELVVHQQADVLAAGTQLQMSRRVEREDRKSTRLNSSHKCATA